MARAGRLGGAKRLIGTLTCRWPLCVPIETAAHLRREPCRQKKQTLLRGRYAKRLGSAALFVLEEVPWRFRFSSAWFPSRRLRAICRTASLYPTLSLTTRNSISQAASPQEKIKPQDLRATEVIENFYSAILREFSAPPNWRTLSRDSYRYVYKSVLKLAWLGVSAGRIA